MPKVDIVVVALTSPILVGVYQENRLIATIEEEQKSSEALPVLFAKLLKEYKIQSITYANGPGSFMAIKLSYLFFRTLQITKGIKLFAARAFEFNGNTPIKAVGALYFHIIDNEVVTKPLDDQTKMSAMQLPNNLQSIHLDSDNTPNYYLPAV